MLGNLRIIIRIEIRFNENTPLILADLFYFPGGPSNHTMISMAIGVIFGPLNTAHSMDNTIKFKFAVFDPVSKRPKNRDPARSFNVGIIKYFDTITIHGNI